MTIVESILIINSTEFLREGADMFSKDCTNTIRLGHVFNFHIYY